jgi:hypothetical protein
LDFGLRENVRADRELTVFMDLESQLIRTWPDAGKRPTFFY